jgi:hypothetical protein
MYITWKASQVADILGLLYMIDIGVIFQKRIYLCSQIFPITVVFILIFICLLPRVCSILAWWPHSIVLPAPKMPPNSLYVLDSRVDFSWFREKVCWLLSISGLLSSPRRPRCVNATFSSRFRSRSGRTFPERNARSRYNRNQLSWYCPGQMLVFFDEIASRLIRACTLRPWGTASTIRVL